MRRLLTALVCVGLLATVTFAQEPPKVVSIEVKFVEINSVDLLRYGLSWDQLSLRLPINTDVSQFIGPNEIWFGSMTTGIIASVLSMLQQNSKANILSSVNVLAANGTQTVMTLTEDIPVVITELQSGFSIRSIQTFNIGFTLVVIPKVMDGWIDLQMKPTLRIITGQTQDGTPQIATRALEVQLPVKDGATVVVGQMLDSRTTRVVSRIPIMGSLPIIGALFRTTRNQTTETGLTIFVTPKVMP